MKKIASIALLLIFTTCMLTPFEASAKSKIDIVFIIDRSGSMDDDINSVKNNVSTFTDKLSQQGFDYQLGLISYEYSPIRYPLTSDVNTFKNNLSNIYVSGGTENGLDAIMDAINNYTFELNSYKYFVLIGDENVYSANGYSDAYVKQQLVNNDITLTTVGISAVQSQFQDLSSSTGGLYLSLTSGFATNLEIIFDQIQQIPIIETVKPTSNQLLSDFDTSFVPTVRVTDPDSDKLTFEFFIDDESTTRDSKTVTNTKTAQLVAFKALNIGTLSEGTHRFLFKVHDGSDTVQDIVSVRVDKSPPSLQNVQRSSTTNSISVSGSAIDTIGGLHAAPYRYTVGSTVSAWTANTSYIQSGLTPNTAYAVTMEARDLSGHIAKSTATLYTQAETPAFSVTRTEPSALELTFTDRNPLGTQIQVVAGTQYVNASGRLVATPTWITPTSKKLRIEGLAANQSYAIKALARNGAGVATGYSSSINGTTLAHPPGHLTAHPEQRSMTLQWDIVPSIIRYELEADGQIKATGSVNSYIHTGLSPNTQHTYRIRAVNAGGAGEWSAPLTSYTLPDPPAVPGIPAGNPLQTEITVMWEGVAKATAYDIEVDGHTVTLGNVTSYTHVGLAPETPHTYRVRAKNAGGTSEWSERLTVQTLPYPPEIPAGLSAELSIHSVQLNWNASERAVAYEIEVDGFLYDNGSSTQYLHEGLDALSTHTYRVRAKNAGGKSGWSQPLTIKTHPEKPDQPGNILTTADAASITLTWYEVPHAEIYEIELDGDAVESTERPQYVHSGLDSESLHTYRIRAKNISGYSEWSAPVKMLTLPSGSGTGPMSLTNMAAVVTNASITLSWDTVAPGANYEIEVDGELQSIGQDTIYQHTGLTANEFHTYKIRMKQEDGLDYWVAILALSTLPNPPDAPDHIDAFASDQSITLTWDKADGATSYDIEIDGETVSIGNDAVYTHEGLSPGTSHTYRIRAKNMTGVTAWSPGITQSTTSPTYRVQAADGVPFELAVFANHVQDFNEFKVVISFDPSQLELKDMYNFSPQLDRASGPIPGSIITATVSDGQVELMFKQNLVPGTSWSGELTTMTMVPKLTGEIAIDVIVK